jgi:hypothetical protein
MVFSQAILLGDQPVAAQRYSLRVNAFRKSLQFQTITCLSKFSAVLQFVLRQSPEALAKLVYLLFRLISADYEPLVNILVEALEQFRPRILHLNADLFLKFGLEVIKRAINLGLCSAGLVNRMYTLLKVYPRAQGTQDFVRCPEYAAEEPEFLGQQIEDLLSAAFLRLRKFMTTTSCF